MTALIFLCAVFLLLLVVGISGRIINGGVLVDKIFQS